MSMSISMTNKCSFLKVACSWWLFSQEVPFWMFDWILNVSLWNGTSMKWGNNFCIHANSIVLDFHFFSTLLFETNIQTSKTFFFKKISKFYSTKLLIKSKQIKNFSQLVLPQSHLSWIFVFFDWLRTTQNAFGYVGQNVSMIFQCIFWKTNFFEIIRLR